MVVEFDTNVMTFLLLGSAEQKREFFSFHNAISLNSRGFGSLLFFAIFEIRSTATMKMSQGFDERRNN